MVWLSVTSIYNSNVYLYEPFNPTTSYAKSKVKLEKIPDWESLAPTGKVPSGSQPT